MHGAGACSVAQMRMILVFNGRGVHRPRDHYTFGMRRLARSLLIWLTLLALPVYGFAAAGFSMRCDLAPSMAHAGAAATSKHHADASASVDMPACEHCAGLAGAASGTSFGKCSPSAACGLVAAPARADIVFVGIAVSARMPSAPRAARVDFVTDGPDRPPRG
jgi:hypothetical protein